MNVSPLEYAFAVGKIRALEKFMIKKEAFEEAIKSSLEEALKLFVESGRYSEELLPVKNSLELEAALEKELLRLKQLTGELILDKKLIGLLELKNLEEARRILKDYRSDFFNEYFNYVIDMHNIKTFLRLSILKEPLELLKSHVTLEGFIKGEFFLECYAKDLAFFLHGLEYVRKGNSVIDYFAYLKDAISAAERTHSFIAFEKASADFLIQVLKRAKYISLGPWPLLAYYFAKVNEITLMRMIILAKLNDVSGELVKERVNAVYA